MLGTTRASFGYRDHPARSLYALARSRAFRARDQAVLLPDGVVLIADSGHPNRCYAWTGERSWGVAAALSALLRPASRFLDVGAFCGQHSMRAAHLVGSEGVVVAVEADPRCTGWLRRNLEHAGASDVVVVEKAVVPDEVDRVEFHLADQISMSGVGTSGRTITVDAVRFDRLLEEFTPDVVKIDVEGLDAELVRSSERIGAKAGPVLVVEANDGVAAACSAKGLAVHPLRELMPAPWRSFENLSDDVIAYPPQGLDLEAFTDSFRAELARLRRLPRVSFL